MDSPDRRPAAPFASSQASPLDDERPLTLDELLDGRARGLIASAADALGVQAHLVTLQQRAVIGGALPAMVMARAARQLEELELDGGQRLRAQQILVDGVQVGVLAIGPYPAEASEATAPAAAHLALAISDLIALGFERVVDARLHATSLRDADAELHHKNARLALAVTRLEELDKIKSNFLATVSHELRTPLTSVIGYSEMLLEGLAGPLNAEQHEYVTTVMEKGEQLLGIITGILDISRIEAGGVALDRSRFDVSEVIVSALTTVAPTARRKRLTVEAELPPSLPLVYADRDKVRQIVVNLLGNAVKFTPEGGRVVARAQLGSLRRPSPSPTPAEGGELGLHIAVHDSGIGVPPEALAKIFEPFFQVDSSSTREYGGTGLGLSIVRSFVHAHGGAVWVESSPGEGSTFYVTLPLAD